MSEARKIQLERVAMVVTPRFEQTGSIGSDDVASRLLDVETRLELESSAPSDDVAKLVETAERMCFLMDAIRQPHRVVSRVSLNGEAFSERD